MELSEARMMVASKLLPVLNEIFTELTEQKLIHGEAKAIAHGITALACELVEGRWIKHGKHYRDSTQTRT